MSLRSSSLFDEKPVRGPGTLFGEAIGTPAGGLWHPFAVSPPRTPPNDSQSYEPLPPEFHLPPPAPAVATCQQLDSVFPSWKHDLSSAVLVTFAQSADVLTLRASPRLECANVVHPTIVTADAVGWRPMACEATGTRGHLYTLASNGRPTCRIEATIVNDAITRLVIVQPEYSALSVAANMVAPSSLLVYDDVRRHTESLRQLRTTLQKSTDTGYVPVQELVATEALDKLVLTTDPTMEGSVARKHWKEVKMLVMGLSSATADCIDAYTRSEFARIGQSPVGIEAWRRTV